ncbi:hypothetical protein DY000_02044925 [Brassica cretica]|uniref:Gibberellin regulated protein n=1 Tax=Brassica cretica TaxID=69181 RepID=A0ABQ7F819_BRACR|nr:hypothetical protein DY000_02044925 [Brassica cretica]
MRAPPSNPAQNHINKAGPPPTGNQAGGDGAVETSTSRKRNLIWQANFTTPKPPHDRVVTPAAAPPMMTVHSPSCRRRMGTGPELRQGGQTKKAKEKQKDYFYRNNEGLRRRHARSRAGRTPDPKGDLLSLSVACGGKCNVRCSKASQHDLCIKDCNICCQKCNGCVPSGTYGHRDECPCYRDIKNSKGGPKCP